MPPPRKGPVPPKPPYRLQLVIEPSGSYWRQVILGVRQYGFETGRIELVARWLAHEPTNIDSLTRRDGVQGIIAAIHLTRNEEKFRRLPVPVVNVSNTFLVPRLPVVTQDDRAVGRMAGEHLRACGCLRFAFWGQHRASYTRERLEGFREVVQSISSHFDVQEMWQPFGRPEYLRLVDWLRRQTPPLGIFAVTDIMASMVLRAAQELKWRVPEDLAVLGADDDEFLVEIERPPLTSIRLPARGIGYAAARAIDRLISGESAAATGTRLPPLGVVARQSTDVINVSDEAVARAVRYIRNHATANPYVGDVARAAGVSRSSLQARFRAALGRSMLKEIQTVRIERAKQLLGSTDLKLEIISERCGFPNSQRFSTLFREQTGTSPGRYRKSILH